MSYIRQDFIDKINRLVRDKDSQLDDADAPDALDSAVLMYSRYRPVLKMQAYTGDGTKIFPLPTGWVEDFSDENYRVEYPVDTTANQQQYLDRQMCEPYLTPTGKVLRFRATVTTNFTPSAGEAFNVQFGIPHTLTDATNDISDAHFLPVCWLGASYLCTVLQQRYSEQSDQNGPGQLADFRDKAQKFQTLATQYKKQFDSVIIPKAEDLRAAFRFAEFEGTPLHRERYPEFPETNEGYLYTDI